MTFARITLDLATRLAASMPYPARRATARLAARAAMLAQAGVARVTRRNLSLCFPDLTPTALRRMTYESLEQTALLLLEAGMVLHSPVEKLEALILQVRGLDELNRAASSGRGVLLLGPHYGNWEILSLYLGRHGMVAMFDPPRQLAVSRVLQPARERTGTRLLPLDRAGLRQACRTLVGGGLLGLLPDQVPDPSAGIHAPFFGRPALTMTLAHRLIQRYQPAVLLAFARRHLHGFVIEIRPLDEAVADADAATATAAINRSIEAVVREDPAQYQWEYKRFRRGPQGVPPVY